MPNVKDEPAWKPSSGTKDVRAWIGIPVFDENDAIGFITLDFPDTDADLARHSQHLGDFVADIAMPLLYVAPLMREQELIEVTKIVKQTLDLIGKRPNHGDVLQAICNEVVRHLNCSHCTMFFPERQNNELVLVGAYPSPDNGTETRTFPLGKSHEQDWGVAGWVFRHGEPVISPRRAHRPTILRTSTGRARTPVDARSTNQSR